jgi:hypothetical protein
MNKEIKQEWVKALRSGEYEQGRNQLKTKNGKFCCLGVLCDLYSKKNNVPWSTESSSIHKNFQHYTIHGALENLPDQVKAWAGLQESDPVVKHKDPFPTHVHLSYINDQGTSFAEIANIIEEEF